MMTTSTATVTHTQHTTVRTALSLVRAELGRALRTRSTVTFLAIALGVTLAIITVRVLLARGSTEPLTGEVIPLSADVIGFLVMFTTALAVARDHQSGAIELIRVLTPSRGRQLLALAAAHALLAMAVVLLVLLVGTGIVLAVEPSAYANGVPGESFARLLLTSALLALAGAGVGALCRSSAAATFAVLTLYLILPVAFLIAGLAGQSWAGPLSDMMLGLLAATALSASADAWPATAGVGAWALGLLLLGVLRDSARR